MAYFVITHKTIPWNIPFDHYQIGVEGFRPENGIAAGDYISQALDQETAFGGMRSLMAIRHVLEKCPADEDVFIGSYRLFLGQEMLDDWLSPIMQENKIITSEELQSNWQSLVTTEIPAGVDLLIPAPRLLPDTILGQFARVHHLDDLLFGVGCAIRSGLVDPLNVPTMLTTNTLIPYGIFAAKRDFRLDFNDRVWWCANQFYKEYYMPRSGYQRRVIDFVFERITSMAIINIIVKQQLNCKSCRNIIVSDDGSYIPST